LPHHAGGAEQKNLHLFILMRSDNKYQCTRLLKNPA
jgi:hypothetical protein